MKFGISVSSEILFDKIQVSLKYEKNNGQFEWKRNYKNILDSGCRENQNTFYVQ